MKKTLLILTSLLILSCVSLPNPQETNTGMVVFNHKLDNKAKIDIFGQYRITIEGVDSEYKTFLRIPKTTGMVKFYLEPGKYKITNIEFVFLDSNKAETIKGFSDRIKTLNVEEGKIIIINQFMNTYTKIEDDSYWMYYNITPASRDEINKVKEKIMAVDGSDMWEFK